MNKIYAFIIIIPLIAMLFIKGMAFYEYDTKQRYIKNEVDAVAHKVMLTGVLTVSEKDGLINKLKKLGNFDDSNLLMSYGSIQPDGSISGLNTYTLGNVMSRGEVFCIYVESENESILSKIEGDPDHAAEKILYKAKATCRIEKNQNAD